MQEAGPAGAVPHLTWPDSDLTQEGLERQGENPTPPSSKLSHAEHSKS